MLCPPLTLSGFGLFLLKRPDACLLAFVEQVRILTFCLLLNVLVSVERRT